MKNEEQNLNKEQKPQLDIAAIMGSADFQNRLKEAVECGIGESWCFDGEVEYSVDTFNAYSAVASVMELLKEYFYNGSTKPQGADWHDKKK